ncbi:hypothetical protein Zm00014a_002432 [Zea mays]|uniref:Transducin/WD40 repeat-like superfamily protein n=3 Tax=Zea mays TaxID=4577 RepID=A0A317YB47_MAIZE|nr:hypothetical protein Zm00014a_002432 [Zea mays]PWZ55743.1 hypothetical protein Zm00014a_002432 [Zea mays]
MAPQYQAATLIASPSYPSAIAWSSDNLVAVASGHIVTILNPSALDGPRGLVGLCRSDPFPIGLVNREDLLEPCLLSTSLARETEPCARSISWSQQGFAPNSGCLLAVCTMDGHVKLYRSPIWELCDEWVEVADISQLLFNYYKLINFGEDNGSHLTSLKNTNTGETEVLGSAYELQESLYFRCPGQRKLKRSRVDGFIYDVNEVDLDASKDADFSIEPCSKSKKKYLKKTVKPRHEVVAVNERNNTGNIKGSLSSNGENKSLPLITAKQYACRAAHLSSLVVSWSPVVSSSDKTSCLLRHWCIIAVGSKSGNLSFWKLPKPEYYTIDAGVVTSDPMLIGVLQAHKSCVSVIAWQVLSAGSSKSSLLLATGCSDGSVKIWLGNIEGLNQCASGEVPFALVAVVATDLSSPVSSISLAIPAQSQHEVSLAIGRVSGSLEIWIWNASSNKIEIFSAWHAHDQVVTGLQWAMDGYCLFSCSQDNSARCWISHENHLEEIFMHSKFPELRESADLSELSDRCYGLTLAPGEQMIAVVRSLDLNLLNQMYQVRTQKAVVEFIWIGGQFVGIPLDRSIDICSSQSTDLSSSNLMWWGSNILWSLKKYENVEKRLVIWDVVAVLQELKKSAPAFLETLVHSWVSVLLSGDPQCVSIDAPSRSMHDMMPYVSTRKLHLLNIMCRKVMVSIHTHHGPGAENGNEETTDFWSTLLVRSETELRERLVGFTFAAVLKRTAYLFNGTSTENCWFPVGVAQMDSWVTMNYDGQVHDQLQSIRSKIKDLGSRCMHFSISIDQSSAIQFHLTGSSFRIDGYSDVESCPYCSSPVHFESPDVAICGERHTLPRCRASMILCSVVQPLWHCVCCGGTVNKLLPESFFTMQASTMHDEGSLDLSAASVPLCPFCGILLQRSMPAFLLSTSPA